MSDVFAEHAGKRSVERAWLAYTPVWGAAAGLVMLTGLAERWGDVALMTFGALLALGALLAPYRTMPVEQRARPFWRRTATRMSVAVVLLSFGLNYFQTPYFFDVLHMRYGFRVGWTIDRNPIFLYLLTIPYFATYSVLAQIALRAVRKYGAAFTPQVRMTLIALVPFALALLETALNANPFMTSLFCYDELGLMLWFGTLSYGVSFVLALPTWLAIDERPGRETTIARIAALTLLVVALDTGVLAFVRSYVAPHLTTVVDDASGGVGGCLQPIRE